MSDRVRLSLSICSTFLLLTLGIEYLWDFYHQNDPFASQEVLTTVSALCQYLLLGTVAIYLAHNFMQLFMFIPGAGNKEEKKDREKLIKQHLKRYSSERTGLVKLLVTAGIVGGLCGANYFFELIDRHILIWGILLITSITFRDVKIEN